MRQQGWQKGLAVGYSVLLTAAVLICRIGGSSMGIILEAESSDIWL